MTPVGCRTLATVFLGLVVAVRSPPETDTRRAAAVRRQAEQTAKAVVDGDYETLAKLTHPALVQQMGGRQQMIARTKAAMEGLRNKGFRIVAYSVEPPASFTSNGTALFAVVPTRIEMTAPGGRLIARSCLIGVSSDDGANWKFADLGGKPDASRQVFPDLPGTLRLPPAHKPEFVREP